MSLMNAEAANIHC